MRAMWQGYSDGGIDVLTAHGWLDTSVLGLRLVFNLQCSSDECSLFPQNCIDIGILHSSRENALHQGV